MTVTRPVGPLVEGWTPPPTPGDEPLTGAYAELVRLSAEDHAADLFSAFEGDDSLWDYMPNGPYHSAASYYKWVREAEASHDPHFYAIRNLESGAWEGVCSLLRIAPEAGSVEVGFITYAPALQRTLAATEAMYLLMNWAFAAGYRRYEWKCNALNLPSRAAAQRLGFSYEGVFRQHMIVKGRNRDTAWFAMTDQDWPGLQEAYRLWLSPENFDAAGNQKERLSDLTRLVRVASDPALRA